jgi:phosphatidylglycerophosphatase GEP4
VFTDVVLANRMRGGRRFKNTTWTFGHQETESSCQRKEPHRPDGPLAIWTTGVWEKEAMSMRILERKLVEVVQCWTKDASGQLDTTQFVKNHLEPESSSSGGMVAGLFKTIRRS